MGFIFDLMIDGYIHDMQKPEPKTVGTRLKLISWLSLSVTIVEPINSFTYLIEKILRSEFYLFIYFT